jgi:hypothetical protein
VPRKVAREVTETAALDRLVARARRRLRAIRVLVALPRLLIAASLIVIVWSLIGRFVLLPDVRTQVVLGAMTLVVIGALAATLRRIPESWAARAADRWLDSRDRFATALELHRSGADQHGGLAARQVVEAEAAAGAAPRLPRRPVTSRRWVVGAVVATLAAGVISAAPDPQAAERAERAAQAEAVAEVARELERVAEQLTQHPAGSDAAEQLREVAEALEASTLEAALEELAIARAELARELDPDRNGRRAALDGLAKELERAPLAAGEHLPEQLESLAAALADGTGDHGELAERLDQLADAVGGGQPELAAALGDAAGALAAGNPGAASTALSDAAVRAGGAIDAATRQLAVEAADGALADAQRDLRDPGSGQGQGQGRGQGQGEGQGEGESQGQGQGEGQGQGGQAGQGGAGRGSQPGDGSTGSAGLPDATGRAAEGDGRERTTVFAPPGAIGDTDPWQLPGNDDGQGPVDEVGRSLGEGQANRGLVPYLDVLPDYRDAATRTIERPGFPSGRRDLVRDYFDELAR